MQRDTHILKIVNNGRTFRKDIGVTCFPEQTYGISEEAPEEMKRPFSLKSKNGYIYRYDNQHPSNKIQNEQQQEKDAIKKKYMDTAFSQKKYCSVVGNSISEVQNFRDIYQTSFLNDKEAFHRKKGRMTEFMDKNGWMNKVIKIMGFQRDQKARIASNLDRKKRIQSLPKRKIFENPVALKPLQKQLRNSSLMYKQKAKIRGQRFSFRQKNNQTLQIQRPISTARDKYLEAQTITNKMGRTMMDKQWRETMNTIRTKSPNKRQDIKNFTSSDWNKNYKTIQPKTPNDLSYQVNSQQLKDWFNSTCNSSTNPWKYRKPKKMATNSSDQNMGNDD